MNAYSIYSKMPIWLQNWLVGMYSYKIERQRYGREYEQIFQSLVKSDEWNPEQIRAYKEDMLKRIITHAYCHCLYYRRKYDAAGVCPDDFTCIDDLRKFPILTKEEIRRHWREMLADNVSKKELIAYHTSGSTGKALDFYWTQHALTFYWAAYWRSLRRFDIDRGECHLNFTGKIVVPIDQNRPPYWRFKREQNQYMINMQHITRDKVSDIVDFINKIGARFFVGYPSIICALAELIDEMDLKITNPPQYIFSSAEKMYDFQRMKIQKVFPHTVIMEHYGFSEGAASASKSPDGFYHEDFELGHLELKDPIDCGTGYMGSLIATGFQNYGMPFIRYEIGDTATFTKEHTGKYGQCITDIEGRNGDYVLTPEGARIMRFGYIFKQSDTIKECQIVQSELGEMTVRIVPRGNYVKALSESEIVSAVRKQISPTIKVNFEYLNAIPRTKSGKFKAVVSELNR